MAGVLEGIRVLDFGRYIAGPFCGTMLGDLGAEVIRIEKLDGSEDRWVTPVAEGGEGAMFLQMGRNKLGLTLNPMKPAGQEIVKKLVAVSDVVIANLPYEDLKTHGHRLRHHLGDQSATSSSPPTRPSARRARTPPASASTRSARRCRAPCTCRATARCRRAPTRPYVDFSSALLSTVRRAGRADGPRQRRGKGQQVETALLRTAINITNSHLIEQAVLSSTASPRSTAASPPARPTATSARTAGSTP